MIIRPFRLTDAPALAALFHASVRQGGIRDYSAAQVAAWSPAPPLPTDYFRRAERCLLLVAVDGTGAPLGYGTLVPDGHIDHLYCRPDVIGTGVGAALCTALEAAARAVFMPLLFTEASEAARRLLARQGFRLECRNDFILNGTAIHNYRMIKPLPPQG